MIDAVQWRGGHTMEVIQALAKDSNRPVLRDGHQLIIQTLEGDHRANPGDWIIKGVQGELYPCKPDIFEATYEPVEGIDK